MLAEFSLLRVHWKRSRTIKSNHRRDGFTLTGLNSSRTCRPYLRRRTNNICCLLYSPDARYRLRNLIETSRFGRVVYGWKTPSVVYLPFNGKSQAASGNRNAKTTIRFILARSGLQNCKTAKFREHSPARRSLTRRTYVPSAGRTFRALPENQ